MFVYWITLFILLCYTGVFLAHILKMRNIYDKAECIIWLILIDCSFIAMANYTITVIKGV